MRFRAIIALVCASWVLASCGKGDPGTENNGIPNNAAANNGADAGDSGNGGSNNGGSNNGGSNNGGSNNGGSNNGGSNNGGSNNGGSNNGATCDDVLLNGDETGVDCGGSCEPCGNGEPCDSDDDCRNTCIEGTCDTPASRRLGVECEADLVCESGQCGDFGTEGSICTQDCGGLGDCGNGTVCFDGTCTPMGYCSSDPTPVGPGCPGCGTCPDGAFCQEDPPGTFACVCADGYEGDGTACSDIDECMEGTATCDAMATCRNTDGAYICRCNRGWIGDGFTCADENECQAGTHACDPNASCSNTEGSYQCRCLPGFVGTGMACSDVDECVLEVDNCDPLANCSNSIPGYDCTCQSGYSGDGVYCTDDDECGLGTDDCDPNAACDNRPGSFVCTCNSGYDGDGKTCTQVDDCATVSCGVNAVCRSDGAGGTTCECRPGFVGDPDVQCDDVDECSDGTANCDVNATCTNRDGGFDCACPATGWRGDGVICEDIDECDLGTAGCDPNAACTNTVGSFLCECDAGYAGDGFTCSDVDECGDDTHSCHPDAQCTNVDGGYECDCYFGFRGDGFYCLAAGDVCSDAEVIGQLPYTSTGQTIGASDDYSVSACTGLATPTGLAAPEVVYSFEPPENASYSFRITTDGYDPSLYLVTDCADTTGTCSLGVDGPNNADLLKRSLTMGTNYFLIVDGGLAGAQGSYTLEVDVDECVSNTDDCAADAICTDTFGSFECDCRNGFMGDGRICNDINECDTGQNNCSPDADCMNSAGSFSCSCKSGFHGDGRVCTNTTGDHCAIPLSATKPLPAVTNGDSSGFQDLHSSAGCPGIAGRGEGSNDVVYEFQAPSDGTFQFELLSPGWDSILYVTTRPCGACIISVDSGVDIEVPEVVQLAMSAGEALQIVVDGWGNGTNDAGAFTLTVTEVMP